MEITVEYATAKTTHEAFPLGHKFSFASSIIKTAKFIALHDAAAVNIANLNAFDHYPVRPETYDPLITSNMGEIAQ